MAGWAWLEAATDEGGETPPDLCRAAAACFGGPDGHLLTRHLRRLFLDRRLPPTASDAELRHLEGQRTAVAHLLLLADRGRRGPPEPLSTSPETRDPR